MKPSSIYMAVLLTKHKVTPEVQWVNFFTLFSGITLGENLANLSPLKLAWLAMIPSVKSNHYSISCLYIQAIPRAAGPWPFLPLLFHIGSNRSNFGHGHTFSTSKVVMRKIFFQNSFLYSTTCRVVQNYYIISTIYKSRI